MEMSLVVKIPNIKNDSVTFQSNRLSVYIVIISTCYFADGTDPDGCHIIRDFIRVFAV